MGLWVFFKVLLGGGIHLFAILHGQHVMLEALEDFVHCLFLALPLHCVQKIFVGGSHSLRKRDENFDLRKEREGEGEGGEKEKREKKTCSKK